MPCGGSTAARHPCRRATPRSTGPYDEVADDAAVEKQAIARRAAHLVRDGDTVLLDIGTTTGALARELRGRAVTVITPSLAVLDALRSDPTTDVIVLGGLVRRRYHSLVGVLTEEALRQVHATTVFLGTSGVDANGWVLDTTSVEVPTKRGLIQAADQVVLLADHTKFPGQGVIRVCGLDSVSALVTTDLADPSSSRPPEPAARRCSWRDPLLPPNPAATSDQ